jgi:hypothetical protein
MMRSIGTRREHGRTGGDISEEIEKDIKRDPGKEGKNMSAR